MAELHTPYDLERLDDGTWLIADSGNSVIRKIAPDGIITTLVGTSSAGFSGDHGPARAAHQRVDDQPFRGVVGNESDFMNRPALADPIHASASLLQP